MWIMLEVIFDRSENQKPARTNPLVTVPRYPTRAISVLIASRELGIVYVHSDDVVIALLAYFSVWISEDSSPVQSTVDDITNAASSEEITADCSVGSISSTVCY